MAGWVDSHAHLSMLGRGAADALRRAHGAGVTAVVCVGTDASSSADAVALAAAHPEVRATVGLHPHDAARLDDEWPQLVALADGAGVVAIGETGLDFHYRHSPDEDQERAFRRQIELAKTRGVALVVHSRAAWDDTFRILEDEGPPEGTVLHCFTGGPDEARRCLDLGASLSFSGVVTFKNASEVRAAAALCPTDRLLVETDSPFLAPVPHRGTFNEPSRTPLVGATVAQVKGLPTATLAAGSTANALAMFSL